MAENESMPRMHVFEVAQAFGICMSIPKVMVHPVMSLAYCDVVYYLWYRSRGDDVRFC